MSDYNEFDDTSDMTEDECRQMLRIVGNERDALREEREEARRENERLRDALDTIECETYSTSIRDIARAALIGREVNKDECFTSSEIIEGLKAELAEARREHAQMLKALITIRDSTYRSALMLRGLADDAIAALEGKS